MGVSEKERFRSLGKKYSIIIGAVWARFENKGFSSKVLSNLERAVSKSVFFGPVLRQTSLARGMHQTFYFAMVNA